ncbi:MAG: LemA family protein [Bacilli bacterium]|nr:MAG: LemA family protein [Bacilli bacterium]
MRTSYNKNEFSIEETEKKLIRIFNNIMFLVEAYPDLKANTQFLDLQNTLKRNRKIN